MDIKELEVKINKTLNPKLWERWQEKRIGGSISYTLKDEVLNKLREIGKAFIEFLDIPKDAVKDIRLLGSSANYNYTKYSDIDLHLVVDFNKVHKDCPIVAGYLLAQKAVFNKDHDIAIYGIPVELYAESTEDNTASNGVYSVKEGRWVKEPSEPKVNVNDLAVRAKYEELEKAIEMVGSQEDAKNLLDKIYILRKAGLEKGGEFSVENIVFKKLRDHGLISKLKEQVKHALDQELSLDENNRQALIQYISQSVILEHLTR
jgi:predicted nucleotidyltransferase